MLEEYWTLSTDKPGISSSGASKNDSMTQWNLETLFDAYGTQGAAKSVFECSHCHTEGAHLFHFLIVPQGTVNTSDTIMMLMKRLFCHVVIDRLPTPGVEEAFETLRGMFEFHTNRPRLPSLPSTVQKVSAHVGQTYERPPFHYVED